MAADPPLPPGMRPRRGRLLRRTGWIAGALLALVLLAALAARLSSWPSALVLRWVFERGGAATNAALADEVPPGVASRIGLRYAAPDPDALLDLHFPARKPPPGGWPLIVWIHGGGFVAGHRGEVANYARILAAHGHAVASVDYGLAPEHRYPLPVRQVARAVGWLSANAGRLGVDARRIVIAGDSAGAQLAAQVALLATSPGYAARVGIEPPVDASRLAGTVLFCGPVQGERMSPDRSWFNRTVMWSYFGAPHPAREVLEQFSILPHANARFPPTFISAGNGDPLAPQSVALAAALRRQGVRVDTLFFPPGHEPALPHEYQFDLSRPESREALARVLQFVAGLQAEAQPAGAPPQRR